MPASAAKKARKKALAALGSPGKGYVFESASSEGSGEQPPDSDRHELSGSAEEGTPAGESVTVTEDKLAQMLAKAMSDLERKHHDALIEQNNELIESRNELAEKQLKLTQLQEELVKTQDAAASLVSQRSREESSAEEPYDPSPEDINGLVEKFRALDHAEWQSVPALLRLRT